MNTYSVIRIKLNGREYIDVRHFVKEEDYKQRIDSIYSSFDAKDNANREARRLSRALKIPLYRKYLSFGE
jgi:hypothetical protein